MRTCILLVAITLFGATAANAAVPDPGKGERTRPPTAELRPVPMESIGVMIKMHGRWIRVRGLGNVYLAPNFPAPYPRCTASTKPGRRCYEEIPRR